MGGFFFLLSFFVLVRWRSYLDHKLWIQAHVQPILTRDLQLADEALLLMGRLGGKGYYTACVCFKDKRGESAKWSWDDLGYTALWRWPSVWLEGTEAQWVQDTHKLRTPGNHWAKSCRQTRVSRASWLSSISLQESLFSLWTSHLCRYAWRLREKPL